MYQLFKTSKFVEKEVICDMFDRYEVLLRQQEICNIEQEALDTALKDLRIQSKEDVFIKDRDELSSNNKIKSLDSSDMIVFFTFVFNNKFEF